MIRFTIKVLPSVSKQLGIITWNHPQALHALTLDMIYCVQDVLLAWCQPSSSSSHQLKAILFKSSTYDPTQQKVRAFCAGGNVKDVYLSGIPTTTSSPTSSHQHPHGYGHDGLMTSDFFRQEYIMNHMLSQLNGSTVRATLFTRDTARRPADETEAPTTLPKPQQHQQQQQPQVQLHQQLRQLQQSKFLPIQISIWDGIVMGGGVGVSIYGQYRIVTEHTIFSMPETAIGLFPDVGSMYILPRIVQHYSRHAIYSTHAMSIVTYLLLTGTRLKPYDIYTLGLATHYIPSSQLLELEQALIQATATDDVDDDDDDEQQSDDTEDTDHHHHHHDSEDTNDDSNVNGTTETTPIEVIDVIGPILDQFHDQATKTNPLSDSTSTLLPHMNDIIHAFSIDSKTTMEDIIGKLQDIQSTSSFAQQTMTTLLKMSPTSLKLTLLGLQRHLLSLPDSQKPTFYEELQYEYRIAQHCMRRTGDTPSDFYEGIRAALIDKDHTPKWSPSTLQDVTDATIYEKYIQQSIPNEWELPRQYDLLALHPNEDSEASDLLPTTKTESKL